LILKEDLNEEGETLVIPMNRTTGEGGSKALKNDSLV